MEENHSQDQDQSQQSSNRIDENSKNKQLEQFREDAQDQYMTTDQGVRINHTDDSLKAGSRG